jgi:uncharacterized RDD family membrane protein YckC
MDTSFSVPPPGHPLPGPAARTAPVGDLKRLDSRRLRARLLDSALLLPISLVMAKTQDVGLIIPLLLLTLLYFFVAEATKAQTFGKRRLGLRVMQRDGSAPTVNQISVRTVLRLIDDGPIGLVVIVLSGKRRQRIGDMLAGTTVGTAGATVPKPAASPLLFVYPVGWAVAAVVWFFAISDLRAEDAYLREASAICARTAEAWAPDITTAQWISQLEAQQAKYAALRPPESLAPLHAELLAIGRTDIQLGHRFLAAEQRGDRSAYRRIERRATALNKRRDALGRAGLEGCT